MNRSYSKIRHIQESNLMLENRRLEEKSFIYENEIDEDVFNAEPYELKR